MHEQVQTLVEAGRLDAELGEKISLLEPGVFCLHKSWGPGAVKDWDLFGGKMVIDFESKPGHSMKLEFAANSLEVLDAEHLFSKFVGDPEATRQMALDKPVDFARLVLQSFGGSMFLDDFDDAVKERIVPEAKYKSWWESTKKQVRADRRFVLPSKRNLPFELRDESITPAQALIGDFEAAKDAKAKTRVLEAMAKDLGSFTEPAIELEPVIASAASVVNITLRRNAGAATELVLAINDLVSAVDGLETPENLSIETIIAKRKDDLPGIVRGLGVGRQRQIYEKMEASGGDEWEQGLIGCLEGAGARAIGEITKYLHEKGKSEALSKHLSSGLDQRSLGSEVLTWIGKERKGLAADAFVHPGLAAAMIGALERDHLDETVSKSNRLHDILLDDKNLISDLLANSDTAEVRHFTRRIQATPVFEGLNKNSLLARVIKAYPMVDDLISGEKKEGASSKPEAEKKSTSAGLVVSWESLKARQEKFDEIVNKLIPENSKEIGIARDYGDLKENFEFKAAKQQQAVLMRQKAELEVEIATARATDFSDADASAVSIGTIVDLEDLSDGSAETVTVLGAWDTDTDKHIVSYLSGLGSALLGKKIGDELELPTETEGERRKVKVSAIRAYVAK